MKVVVAQAIDESLRLGVSVPLSLLLERERHEREKLHKIIQEKLKASDEQREGRAVRITVTKPPDNYCVMPKLGEHSSGIHPPFSKQFIRRVKSLEETCKQRADQKALDELKLQQDEKERKEKERVENFVKAVESLKSKTFSPKTGIPSLDHELEEMNVGSLVVIMGTSGSGKTMLATEIYRSIIKKEENRKSLYKTGSSYSNFSHAVSSCSSYQGRPPLVVFEVHQPMSCWRTSKQAVSTLPSL